MIRAQLTTLPTEMGELHAVVKDARVVEMDFATIREHKLARLERRFGPMVLVPAANPHDITARLRAYFEGDLSVIDTIEVDPGGTGFQQRVWQFLRTIPAGRTLTYGEVASRLGNANASRAVGAANGQNPIAVVIPCHRLIASTGALTGYASGIEFKRWLLRHEGALAD